MDFRPHAEKLRAILGLEEGPVVKSWGGRIPIALVFPNSYSVGMANLGFQLLYHLMNREEDIVCERVFWEETEGFSPLSLETQQPLRRFEIVAFSIPFENDFLRVPLILKASGIPQDARRRQPPQPMVWVGGVTSSLNPEPLAFFVDLFAIGEAEPLLPEMLETYRRCRAARATKEECLKEMAKVPGVYVPSLYRAKYDERGVLSSFRPSQGAPAKVRRRVAQDLDLVVPVTRVLGPSTEFGSMVLIEIGRGCSRRCRFCAAGHLFFPTRQRSLQSLRPIILEALTRRDTIGLVSSSVADHPDLEQICREILSRGGKLSVSSLRLDKLEGYLLGALVESGHRTLSLAPEAGSQRLRELMGKGIEESQILEAVERIVGAGIPRLRLYFMVGLPTETLEDVEEIIRLVKRLLHRARVVGRGGVLERVTLSVNPFVPKPWTPFQWHQFMDVADLKRRLQLLQRELKRERQVHIVYEPPKWARLQALLSRGDRRISRVLRAVAEGLGWDEALRETNLNPDFYLHRPRPPQELLPWDFIDQGYEKEALWRFYQKALERGPSP